MSSRKIYLVVAIVSRTVVHHVLEPPLDFKLGCKLSYALVRAYRSSVTLTLADRTRRKARFSEHLSYGTTPTPLFVLIHLQDVS